jgi:hypothetical protein
MADWNEDEDAGHMAGGEEEEEGIISQEDCWSVIQSYFDENVTPNSISLAVIWTENLHLVPCANSNRIV